MFSKFYALSSAKLAQIILFSLILFSTFFTLQAYGFQEQVISGIFSSRVERTAFQDSSHNFVIQESSSLGFIALQVESSVDPESLEIHNGRKVFAYGSYVGKVFLVSKIEPDLSDQVRSFDDNDPIFGPRYNAYPFYNFGNYITQLGTERFAVILCQTDPEFPYPITKTQLENDLTMVQSYFTQVSRGDYEVEFEVFDDQGQPFSVIEGYPHSDDEIVLDCTQAADSVINYELFDGIQIVYNEPFGGMGQPQYLLDLDGEVRNFSMLWMGAEFLGLYRQEFGDFSESVWIHEMGHGNYLPHAPAEGRGPYTNPWLVMSGADFNEDSGSRTYTIAPDESPYYKDRMGWLSEDERARWFQGSKPMRVEIEATSDADRTGTKVLYIQGKMNRVYAVSTRLFQGRDVNLQRANRGNGLDANTLQEGVLIEQINIASTSDRAGILDSVHAIKNSLQTGQLANYPGDYITIKVCERTAKGYVVILNYTDCSLTEAPELQPRLIRSELKEHSQVRISAYPL